jgi:hypothetical protein
MAQDNVNKEQVVDPKTGQTITKGNTYGEDVIYNTATPYHEQVQTDLKNKDFGHIGAIFGGPLHEIAYNALIGNQKKDQRFEEAKIAQENEQAMAEAHAKRASGETMVSANTKNAPEHKQNIFMKADKKLTGFFAKGGEVMGKGGPKSDSINAEIEEGSFVVPAEHAHVGKMIRNMMGKKNGKANLHQKKGVPVRLSDSEVIFSPEEKETIESELGEEFLKSLAPEAEHNEEGMANGGELTAEKAKIMLKDNQANGEPLTDKQKRYFGWIAGGRKMATGGYVIDETEGTPLDLSKKPVKTETKTETKSTAKPVTKTKKVAKKPFIPREYIEKQELPSNTLKTMIDQDAMQAENQASNKIDTTPISDVHNETPPAQKNDFWSKVNSSGALDYGIAALQTGIGLKNLQDKRPVFEMDKTFAGNVDKAQAQSQYGFTPEQNFLIDQQNQNLLNREIFGAQNAAGGSAANAYNMTRSAVNNAFNRTLEKTVADTELQQNKQATANSLLLQKNQLNRQIFDDSMRAFQQKQMAGASLLNTGLSNALQANRWQDFMRMREQENKFLNTGM